MRAREEKDSFLKEALRNRLRQELRFLVRSGKYLEPFLIVDNQRKNERYLHAETVKELTLRELGYDISQTLDLDDLEYKGDANDNHFLDLLEIVIIFTKPEYREDCIARLNTIFREEGEDFTIHGFMIISTVTDGLRSIAPLIKEKALKEKISEYYESHFSVNSSRNYELLAQISAGIVQMLFSSPDSKKKTLKFSLALCKDVASVWTDKSKSEELSSLLSDTVKNAKDLSNQISNVRHTDRSTIPVDSPNFYKLIATKNIGIAELVILSLPEKFIAQQDPEAIKDSYLKRYELNKDNGWIVKKKDQGDLDDFDPDNIPF